MPALPDLFAAYQLAISTDDAEQAKASAAAKAAADAAELATETLATRKHAVADLKAAVFALDELGNAPAAVPAPDAPATVSAPK